ncbi:MAG: hypothetical protein ACRCR9_02220, partial [Chitinophagaceae bacterium]
MDLLKSDDIAITRQVNDIGSLSNRNVDFSQKITLPLTANNTRNFNFIYTEGNTSIVPYKRNICELIDADTGEHVIYKGRAVVTKSSNKGYECHIYEGAIDFYKKIENKYLTETGLEGLDHLKNTTTVVASFSSTLPYAYLISDYNGRNSDTLLPSNVFLDISIDYQVPSARVSFLMDRVSNFTGFTFNGATFQTEAFKNWFLTFPKPVPENYPVVDPITSQNSTITESIILEPSGEYVYFYSSKLLPLGFDDAYANNNATAYISIETTGA